MTTSLDAVAFLKHHQDHGVCSADDPAHGLKGLFCPRCEAHCEIHRQAWASTPSLVAWEAEQRAARDRASEEERRILEVVRRREEARLPEVRFTARYGRSDEEDPKAW
jgi:hypothetical protein